MIEVDVCSQVDLHNILRGVPNILAIIYTCERGRILINPFQYKAKHHQYDPNNKHKVEFTDWIINQEADYQHFLESHKAD